MEEQETYINEYELIALSFIQAYQLDEGEEESWHVSEEDPEHADHHDHIEYDKDGIPMGGSKQEIKIREKMIGDYLRRWGQENTDRRVLNKALNEYIYVKSISIIEAKEHASKSHLSTRAIFIIDEVLENALPVRRIPIKQGNKNQSVFAYMLVMVYRHSEIGTIKLTVGVKPSRQRVEYGISTLREGQPLIDNSVTYNKNKKRSSR